MSVLFKCMECKESTITDEARRLGLVSWCGQKCHDAWHKKIEKKGKILRQWSDYMCGAREKPPRSMAHLVEPTGPDSSRGEETNGKVFDAAVTAGGEGGRVCGKCGDPGHNARTCESRKAAAAATKKKKRKKKRRKTTKNVHGEKARKATPKRKQAARRQYKCRVCNAFGHNARTCDQRSSLGDVVKAPGSIAARKMKKKAALKQYKCGRCGGMGHNARTCKKKR